MSTVAGDIGKLPITLGGTALPEGVVVLQLVVANIRIGHSEAPSPINCSFQRTHSVPTVYLTSLMPTVNLDISALLVSIHAERNLWSVKIHHCETGEIACFAIAGALKMSPGYSSALVKSFH